MSDLVTFAQFRKREKQSWRSVTLSNVAASATLLKVTLLTFFELSKWYQIT